MCARGGEWLQVIFAADALKVMSELLARALEDA